MKHLRAKRRNIHWGIKDKDGILLTTKEQILERWASFYADLYAESSVDPQTPIVITNELDIPLILETEIIDGINKLKKNKAPSVYKIYAEFLQAGGNPIVKVLERLFNIIIKTGETPSCFKKALIGVLYKRVIKSFVLTIDKLAFLFIYINSSRP